jgi:hypothetical protein
MIIGMKTTPKPKCVLSMSFPAEARGALNPKKD